MKNLLIITSHLPYPLTSGGNQAQFYLDDYLRTHFNIFMLYNENRVNNKECAEKLKVKWPDVTLLPYNWKKQKRRGVIIWDKLIRKITPKVIGSQTNLINLLPDEEITQTFIDFIKNIVIHFKIDIVQVEFNQFLPLVTILPTHVKTIFVQHEIQYVRYWRQMEDYIGDGCNLTNFVYEMQRDAEISLMNRYNTVVTLTEVDHQKLLNDGVTTIINTSPACVSSTNSEIVYTPTHLNVVFVGGSNHYPNYDGLTWFLNEVWEDVIKEKKDVILKIVGIWDEKIKKEISQKHQSVVFLGYVDDITSVLRNAVMIVPIRIGSGMRMKIVEAANIGCPFISTSVGVEGLDFEPDKDYLKADTSLLFKEELLRLLDSNTMQESFSYNIRRIFREKYSLEVLGQRRLDILNNL